MSDYEALIGKTVCVRYAGVDDQHGLQHPVLEGVAVFTGTVTGVVRGCVARVRLTPPLSTDLIEAPWIDEVFLDLDQAEEVLVLPRHPGKPASGGLT